MYCFFWSLRFVFVLIALLALQICNIAGATNLSFPPAYSDLPKETMYFGKIGIHNLNNDPVRR